VTGRKISLRTAWYSLIVLASIAPAVALSPWLYQKAHAWLLDRAMAREEMFHRQIETRLQLETKRLISVLQNKSDPIAYLLSQHGNMEFIRRLAHKITQRESLLNTTTIYDRDANILVSTHHGGHTPARISKASPAFSVPMHKRVFISPPMHLNDQHLEFLIAVPLTSGDRINGVMIGSVNIRALWRHVQGEVAKHKARVFLIDGRGSLLTSVPGSGFQPGDMLTASQMVRALLAGKGWKSSEVIKGVSGANVFAIGSPVTNLGWAIISEIPSSVIVSPITSTLFMLILIIVILHVLFGLVSLIFTKFMLDPVTKLSAMLKEVSLGNYAYISTSSHYREIDDLTSSFSVMIDEIRKRETSLRKMSNVIKQAGEGVVITDINGTIEYVNPSFTRLTGYAPEEVMGRNPRILNSGKQGAAFYKHMWNTILAGKVWQSRIIERRKDGSFCPVMLTISPIQNEANEITHFSATHVDLTEHDEMQDKFEQAQKMEAVGTLVGGIAHNFNNMLAGITGNMYLLRSKVKGMPELLDKVERVDRLTLQAADMIAELMIFARKGITEKKHVDLAVFLKSAYKMVAITLPESIHVIRKFTNESLPVFGDVTQIQQILLNLLNNARDALENEEKPELVIRLERFEADASFIRKHQDLDEDDFREGCAFARLSVSDNGCGIARENLPDIFEPFFTTKPAGKGTGLGLAMSFGTIREHGGAIEVESVVGRGTTFNVYLPLARSRLAPESSSEKKAIMPGRGEIILLADDDVHVRETTAEVLETMNYTVLQAADGLEALDIFKVHQDDIDLVILDMIMPCIGGMQLAERIRETSPDLPLIFITGYDEKRVLSSHDRLRNSMVLTKPVKFEMLSHNIRKLLG